MVLENTGKMPYRGENIMSTILSGNRPGLILSFLFLLPAGILDWKTRAIPRVLSLTGMLAGAVYAAFSVGMGDRSVQGLLLSLLPGAFLISMTVLTGGKIGIGDGFAFLAVGLLSGFELSSLILAGGLLMAALAGLFLIMLHRAGRNTRLPFLPFSLIACGEILYVLCQNGAV